MIEILYSPKHNKLFIFGGQYWFDSSTMTMTLCLITEKGKDVKVAKIKPKELVHVGWL